MTVTKVTRMKKTPSCYLLILISRVGKYDVKKKQITGQQRIITLGSMWKQKNVLDIFFILYPGKASGNCSIHNNNETLEFNL